MPDFSSAFGGKYVRSADLTKPYVATIDRVEMQVVNETDGTRRPVLYFADSKHRPVVLNNTRYEFLTHLVGTPNTDDWRGTSITIRRGKTRFGGQSVDCVEFGAGTTGEEIDDSLPVF